jgi:hypothetical protein
MKTMINPLNCDYTYDNECGPYFVGSMYDTESLQIPEKQWWIALKKSRGTIDLHNECVRKVKVNTKPFADEYKYIHNRRSIINYGRLFLLLQECYNATPILDTYKNLFDQITEYIRPSIVNEVTIEPDEIEETDKRKFITLAGKWKNETQFSATMIEIAMHPAYQQIIGMGSAAVPLILQRLATEPDHWFWALKAITGDDPVAEDHRGNLKAMTQSWLAWGRKHGYRVQP